MAFSKRQRFEAFKRDRFTCQYCGRKPPTVVLQADHVVPVAEGGPDDVNNLMTSCAECNLGKSDRLLDDTAPPVTQLAREVEEKREQVRAFNEMMLEIREQQNRQIEEVGRYWFNLTDAEKDKYVFGTRHAINIRKFLERLPLVEIMEAVEIAASRIPATSEHFYARWKYFCGICWRKIRAREGAK